MEADITSQAVGLGTNTDFTIKSALKNKLHKEKSVFEARPNAWDVISASIFKVSHLNVSWIWLLKSLFILQVCKFRNKS